MPDTSRNFPTQIPSAIPTAATVGQRSAIASAPDQVSLPNLQYDRNQIAAGIRNRLPAASQFTGPNSLHPNLSNSAIPQDSQFLNQPGYSMPPQISTSQSNMSMQNQMPYTGQSAAGFQKQYPLASQSGHSPKPFDKQLPFPATFTGHEREPAHPHAADIAGEGARLKETRPDLKVVSKTSFLF